MTSFWAGPLTGHMLALLGAEVIHLESATRPDGARLVGGVPQTEDQYWERGPIFAALNTNKKSLTIDLGDERGIDLVRRLHRARATWWSRTTRRACWTSSVSHFESLRNGTARSHHGADAGVRAGRAVARPVGLRLRHRGCRRVSPG